MDWADEPIPDDFLMPLTAEDILATFPEFATAPEAQDTYIALADKLTAAVATWGDDEDVRSLAVAYLAAHMMQRVGLGATPAGAGTVTSERIGSASISYGGASGYTEGELATTVYGQQLMELRNSYIFAALTTYAG